MTERECVEYLGWSYVIKREWDINRASDLNLAAGKGDG